MAVHGSHCLLLPWGDSVLPPSVISPAEVILHPCSLERQGLPVPKVHPRKNYLMGWAVWEQLRSSFRQQIWQIWQSSDF